MGTLFLAIGIIFIVAVVILAIRWNKKEEHPHVYTPQTQGNNQESENVNALTERAEFKVIEVGFGLDGKFDYDGTYYFGKYKEGENLFMRVRAEKLQKLVCLTSKNSKSDYIPSIQFRVYATIYDKSDIAEVATAIRQFIPTKAIMQGDEFCITANMLPWKAEEMFYTIILSYRVDNGNGYGDWMEVDAINIHNKSIKVVKVDINI